MSPENGYRRVEGIQAWVGTSKEGNLPAGSWTPEDLGSSLFPQTGWYQSQKQALHSAVFGAGAGANSSLGVKRTAGCRREADRGWRGRRPGSDSQAQ